MDGRIEIKLFPGEPASHGLEPGFDPEFESRRSALSIAVHGRQPVPGPPRRSQMSRQAAQRFIVTEVAFRASFGKGRGALRCAVFARAFAIRVRKRIFASAVLLVIGAHALADFTEDAFYFIDHSSCLNCFS